MRKPPTIEYLYLDFDGFFASVEQQARPALRGKPIGIVPFDNTEFTCVIACSREAKQRGLSNIMTVKDAKRLCPDLILVPQSPDLYRRAHNTLLAEINAVIPVEAVKSIDEITCRLGKADIAAPHALAHAIKQRLATHVGPYITASIGFAANRQLAKVAGKQDKPDGVTIWHPDQVPQVLYPINFEDIPGIGKNMQKRLFGLGIYTMQQLLDLSPKHMRKIWNNVTGERLWYAFHGYEIKAQKPQRGMFGHGRVLPPELRRPDDAKPIARMLVIKAARRMRNEGYYAGRLYLWCSTRQQGYGDNITLPGINDYQAGLAALDTLWQQVTGHMANGGKIIRLGITFAELTSTTARQLDMLHNDDIDRQRWERVSTAIDTLNSRYSHSVVTLGPWTPPPGGHLGGKISYTRIPKAEDFW